MSELTPDQALQAVLLLNRQVQLVGHTQQHSARHCPGAAEPTWPFESAMLRPFAGAGGAIRLVFSLRCTCTDNEASHRDSGDESVNVHRVSPYKV